MRKEQLFPVFKIKKFKKMRNKLIDCNFWRYNEEFNMYFGAAISGLNWLTRLLNGIYEDIIKNCICIFGAAICCLNFLMYLMKVW